MCSVLSIHLLVIAAFSLSRWPLRISDPTPFGWVVIIAYFSTALLSLFLARISRLKTLDRRFWSAVTFITLALGMNKLFYLERWFTQVARDLFNMLGWQGHKAQLEAVFPTFLACFSVVAFAALIWLFRRHWRRFLLPLLGLVLLATLTLARTSSLHHITHFLSIRVLSLYLNDIFEFVGIVCLAVGMFFAFIRSSNPARTSRS